jgi:hypothetical protein
VIRLEGLTEDQVRAYVVADNRLAELSTWDKGTLAVELQHLIHSEAIDVSITGFEMGEIDLIIQSEIAEPPAGTDGEAVPSGPTTTQPGDLWLLGEHKILCADATDRASYSKLLGSERVRMVFSDPPYNVPIEGHVCGNLLALHPTVKPVALVSDAILDASNRNDIVLDAFLGSGTTLISCARVGRICRAMEIDPVYVDAAIRRWQSETGGRAVHAGTGKSFDETAQASAP